jgi:thiamine biosynthesis lipoprotein
MQHIITTTEPISGSPGLAAHRALAAAMSTLVSIEVLSSAPSSQVHAALDRALQWFALLEQICSRFDPESELRCLCARAGEPTPVSPVLFEVVRFARALAQRTGGAFDPTVGGLLEAKGFNQHYVTGETIHTTGTPTARVSYRDVQLDAVHRTITLRRPLTLDLGAVAKGLAIDLAAQSLSAYDDVCVEAGGDLLARGCNRHGERWRIGIQDPQEPGGIARVLEIDGQAICTSGDYERRTSDGQEHHLVDPRTGRSSAELRSVTVVAPTAMAADGLATAAFILGPIQGLRLLKQEGVSGALILANGEIRMTSDLQSDLLERKLV